MSLNAGAKEWAPPSSMSSSSGHAAASPAAAAVMSAGSWPATAHTYILVGHERQRHHESVAGLLKCVRHASATNAPTPVRSAADAAQTYSSNVAAVREAAAARPCCSHGLFVCKDEVLAAAAAADVSGANKQGGSAPPLLEHAAGLLVPLLRNSSSMREWAMAVELFTDELATFRALCFLATRREEYVVLVAEAGAPREALDKAVERVRSTFGPGATVHDCVLGQCIAAVSLPRACTLLLARGDAAAAEAKLAAVARAITVGNHPPAVTRAVACGALEAPSQTLLSGLQRRAATLAPARDAAPLVTIVTLSVPAVAPGTELPSAHAAAEAVRLAAAQLRQIGLHPSACVTTHPDLLPLADNAFTLAAVERDEGRAKLSEMLWPLPTASDMPTPFAPDALTGGARHAGAVGPYARRFLFHPVATLSEAGRVLDIVRSAIEQRSLPPRPARRLAGSAFAEVAPRVAGGGVLVRRHVVGTRVLVAHIPSLPSTTSSLDGKPSRLYWCDPDTGIVGGVPASVRSSPRPLPSDGVTIFEAVVSPSHLGPEQLKIVVIDVLVYGGESQLRKPLRDRVGLCAASVEADHCYNYRAPTGAALVRAEYVSAAEAYESMAAPQSVQVDFVTCGVVLCDAAAPRASGQAAAIAADYVWHQPEATTCVFKVDGVPAPIDGDAVRVSLVARADGRSSSASSTATTTPGRPTFTAVDGAHCDVFPEMLPQAPRADDALQVLLRRDAEGGYWWEPLRLVGGDEFERMAVAPVNHLAMLNADGTPGFITASAAHACAHDPMLSAGDFEFLLAAEQYTCERCAVLTDQGGVEARASANAPPAYRCWACWTELGLAPCARCGDIVEEESVDDARRCGACHAWALEVSRGVANAASAAVPPALSETQLRSAVMAAHGSRDEHLRIITASAPSQRGGSGSPPTLTSTSSAKAGQPPPYVPAAVPSSLSLQWPTAIASSVAILKTHTAVIATRIIPDVAVVDACCGNDALVEFWLRDANCRAYVGADANPAVAHLVEGKAAILRGPPRVSLRDEADAKAQPMHHTAVCVDALSADFWSLQLRRCLPSGVARASLVTFFRPMPVGRALSTDATAFFAHLAPAVAPGGLVVLLVPDTSALPRDAPWVVRDEQSRASVTFRRANAATPLRPVELPSVDVAAASRAAADAGFELLERGATPFAGDAFEGTNRGLGVGSPLTVVSVNSAGAVVAEEQSWAGAGQAAPFSPCVTDESEAFLRSLKLLTFRRR